MNCFFCQQPASFVCSCGRAACSQHTGYNHAQKVVCHWCAEQATLATQRAAEQARQQQAAAQIRAAQAAEQAAQQKARQEQEERESARRAEEAAAHLRRYGKTVKHTCSNCQGAGQVNGFLYLSMRDCPACHGEGTVTEHLSYEEILAQERRREENAENYQASKSGYEDHHWGDY